MFKLAQLLKYKNYRSRTIDAYVGCVRIVLQPWSRVWQWRSIIDLLHDDVVAFTLYLQEQNKAPKTVNLYNDAVKRIDYLSFAFMHNLLFFYSILLYFK